jgi:hypothetical protein
MSNLDSMVTPTMVSADINSRESQLMRQMQQIEAQANTDTAFDTRVERKKIEPFYAVPTPPSQPLVTLAFVAGCLAIVSLCVSRK